MSIIMKPFLFAQLNKSLAFIKLDFIQIEEFRYFVLNFEMQECYQGLMLMKNLWVR